MYQKSPAVKHAETINKLLSNGYRFAIVANGEIKRTFRFRPEALRHKKRGEKIVTVESLLSYQRIKK